MFRAIYGRIFYLVLVNVTLLYKQQLNALHEHFAGRVEQMSEYFV